MCGIAGFISTPRASEASALDATQRMVGAAVGLPESRITCATNCYATVIGQAWGIRWNCAPRWWMRNCWKHWGRMCPVSQAAPEKQCWRGRRGIPCRNLSSIAPKRVSACRWCSGCPKRPTSASGATCHAGCAGNSLGAAVGKDCRGEDDGMLIDFSPNSVIS